MIGGRSRHGRPLLRRLVAGEGGGFTVAQTILSQLLVVLLNMATGITTARLLGPHGRGVYAAVTLWPQFLSGFGLAGLPAAVVYHLRQSPGGGGAIFSAGIILTSLLSVVTVAAGLVVVPLTMQGYSAESLWLVRYCVLATIACAYIGLFRQVLISLGGLTVCNLSAVLMPLIYLVGLMVCWGVMGVTVTNAVLMLVVALL
ncbi:MAG TPA: hypothetical protein VNE18_08900, partial [Rhodanobacter sp.]|nr:hypothetical protein [Rhodanobacter sp.]